jgi:O-antigen/teichoic acid export membrane protein
LTGTPADESPSSLDPTSVDRFEPHGDLKGRALHGGAVALGTQVAKLALQIGSTAVLARLLTPRDYGVVAMVAASLGFVTLFRDFGLSIATIQRERITHEEVSGLFWVNIASGIALMFVMLAGAPLVAWFYGLPELFWLTVAYAVMAPINSLGAQHQALLQRAMRYSSLAVRDAISLTVGAVVGIAAASLGLGYWALVLMQAATSVCGVTALWWQSGWLPSRPRWVKGLNSLLKFGGTTTLSNVLSFLLQGLDSVLLGYFFGAGGVGVYNRAQSLLSKPMEQVMPAIMSVTTSAFARIASDSDRFERNTLRLLGMVACAAGLVVALTMGTADWLVALLLGPKWGAVVPMLTILALFAFVEPCASLLGTLLVVRGEPGKLVRWRLLSTPIIILGLVAGLRWGPVGVATTGAVSGLLVRAPLFFWFSGRALGLSPPHLLRGVLHYVFAGLVVAAALIFLRLAWSPENALLGLVAYGTMGTVLYGGMVLARPDGRRLVGELRRLGESLIEQWLGASSGGRSAASEGATARPASSPSRDGVQ